MKIRGTVKSVAQQLHNKHLRVTPIRVALLTLLGAGHAPRSVGELLGSLRKHQPNKTTLYRELAALVGVGLVRVVQLGDRSMRYEATSQPHHHHVVCVDCGKTNDVFVDQDIERHARAVSRSTRFKVLNHSLEFFGLCASCQPA